MWKAVFTILVPDRGLEYNTLDRDKAMDKWMNTDYSHLLCRSLAELPELSVWVPITATLVERQSEIAEEFASRLKEPDENPDEWPTIEDEDISHLLPEKYL